jgi:hypothetical protein
VPLILMTVIMMPLVREHRASHVRASGVGAQRGGDDSVTLLLGADVQFAANLAFDRRQVWKRLLQEAQRSRHLCFAHLGTTKHMIRQAVHQLTGLYFLPGFGIVPDLSRSCRHAVLSSSRARFSGDTSTAE